MASAMDRLLETLGRHKARLLALPGCTGVAIGFKVVGGTATDRLAIVVFVERKRTGVSPAESVPAVLDDVPLDVVERRFGLQLTATDPFDRFDEMFSGISIASRDNPPAWGTFGCVIHTTGTADIPAGNYLLTNQHVLEYADPSNPHSTTREVIQPGNTDEPAPVNYNCGDYVSGLRNETNDCAIATIGYGRTWRNEVPNHPLRPGRRDLGGIGAAAVNQEVYKYGATTKNTRGIVTYVHFDSPNLPIRNAIYVENPDREMWCAKGDSGSVLIRYHDEDTVVGLNFAADEETMLPPDKQPSLPNDVPAYWAGFAYDIQSQMNNFGGVVTLAPNP